MTQANPFTQLLEAESQQHTQKAETAPDATRNVTQKATRPREMSREKVRTSETTATVEALDRDAIQLFSFQLRDELKAKAKVQAEVPYQWLEELEQIAQQVGVKKLELYRYIIGTFLGKLP